YNSVPMRIKFLFFTDGASGASDIRVQFNDKQSCSYIGRDAECHLNKPTLWLDRLSTIKSPEQRRQQIQRTVLHEFGHALGMVHEHGHPDYHADWNWRVLQARTGWTAEEVKNNYKKHQSPRTKLAPYDPKSVMHYSIEPGDAHNAVQPVPLNSVLSDGDKRFLLAIYPLPTVSKPTLKPNPVVASVSKPAVAPTPSKPAVVTTNKPVQKPAPSTSVVTVPCNPQTNVTSNRQVTGPVGTIGTVVQPLISYTHSLNTVSYYGQGQGTSVIINHGSVIINNGIGGSIQASQQPTMLVNTMQGYSMQVQSCSCYYCNGFYGGGQLAVPVMPLV
ncbi:hypothetical protein B0T21DRAFT_250734, partial [Apiosordaria backusii]